MKVCEYDVLYRVYFGLSRPRVDIVRAPLKRPRYSRGISGMSSNWAHSSGKWPYQPSQISQNALFRVASRSPQYGQFRVFLVSIHLV